MSLELITTVNGHRMTEAASALQKTIRRGLVDDAIYWAADIYLSGFGEYLWKRLRIITSEDIGPADRYLPATIAALHANYQEALAAGKKGAKFTGERLYVFHAVVLLATAPKCRIVDHVMIHHLRCHAELKRDVPDYALDQHTQRGRKLGRGVDHFFNEGTTLSNYVDDEYKELARKAMQSKPPAEVRSNYHSPKAAGRKQAADKPNVNDLF
ncbi:MAG: hypothetical protein SGJ20_09525 [Planctomycetota bacterium]|nr:hypothetical protein [Planctomycetota bacterium]